MDVSQTALLLSLHISTWDACRGDKRVSEDVARRAHVDKRRAGHYNKYLVDVAAPSYAGVRAAGTKLREFHYANTLPWSDGWGIIAAAAYPKYAAEFRKLEGAYHSAVADFLADYPRLKANARVELNGLYDEADYPTTDAIRNRFDIKLRKMEVPNTSDIRVKMSKDFVDTLRADITSDVNDCLSGAMTAAWTRLRERVGKLVETLGEKDKIFRDTLVTNARDECKLLASLNLVGDKNLDTIRYEIEKLLRGVNAQDLREDGKLRKQVAADAAEINRKMASFMGV
jgi:hypothetical protein